MEIVKESNTNDKTIARRLVEFCLRPTKQSVISIDRHATVNANLLKQSLAMGSKILALPLVLLVVIYQRTLSPDHGMLKPWFPYGYCKFHPSCSEYTRLVLLDRGILGLLKIIKRLISCRPGVAPAIDHP